MARYREPFIVFPRVLSSGRTVFYYQTYRSDGSRTSPRSTGKVNRTRARAWCVQQFRDGTLIDPPPKTPTLKEYARDYFDYEHCPFIQARLKRGAAYSPARAATMRKYLTLHVLPFFGSKRIDQITPAMIEGWLHRIHETPIRSKAKPGTMPKGGKTGKRKEPKKRTASTVMHIYAALRTILTEAYRRGDIPRNPCERVKPLIEASQEKGILTPAETKKLLDPHTVSTVWDGQYLHYVVNRFAASTGCRLGECLGLTWDHVHEGHVHVCQSWDKATQTLKSTKTGAVRDVPITEDLYRDLADLKVKYGITGRFVFSLDEGNQPVFDSTVRKWFNRTLQQIGIMETERVSRLVSFHGWRHQFNTRLIESGLSGELIRKVTGHKTASMTVHYEHADTTNLEAVLSVQRGISK